MRAVRVGDCDALQVARRTAERVDRLQHETGVALEERVDERQLSARVDQEGVHATACLVAERVHARCELDHARRQGANGFATPSSAGSSAGKWRRSNDRIDVLSTQSSPARV